ncbi:MAG: hypothetical protein E7G82_05165 [Veillonella sp.]|nr:hypothetical protein [Veillonella sp.]
MIKVIDLRSEFYYDSFIKTHATPDEKEWFWLDSSFQSYGDAYEDE